MDWQWSYVIPLLWLGPFQGLIAIFFAVAVIILIILILRPKRAAPIAYSISPRSPGLSLLEERYARGEIEREEFLQKKQDLL